MERKPDPPPLETDDARTVAVGTAAWVVALVAGLATGNADVAWTATAGAGLGLIGFVYVRRRASSIRRRRGEH